MKKVSQSTFFRHSKYREPTYRDWYANRRDAISEGTRSIGPQRTDGTTASSSLTDLTTSTSVTVLPSRCNTTERTAASSSLTTPTSITVPPSRSHCDNDASLPTSGVTSPLTEATTLAGPRSAEEDADAQGRIHDFSHLDGSQEDPAPDSEPSILDAYVDLNTLSNNAQLEAFVKSLRNASLDDPCANLDDNLLSRLQNPPKEPVNIDDNDILTGLDLFLGNINLREVMMRRHPDENIPSFDQIKHIVAEITGVVPMVHHMCANSCIAYTGPFSELDQCPYCGEDRYDPKTNAAKQELHMIPLGPQLQALFRDSKNVLPT